MSPGAPARQPGPGRLPASVLQSWASSGHSATTKEPVSVGLYKFLLPQTGFSAGWRGYSSCHPPPASPRNPSPQTSGTLLYLRSPLGDHKEMAPFTEGSAQDQVDRGFAIDLRLRLGAEISEVI